MEKDKVVKPPPSEGARRATGDGGGDVGKKPQRFSARLKTQIVLRLLRGEDLELLSREFGTTAAVISEWREQFLFAGTAVMKKRSEPESEEARRLKQMLGEATMDCELLREKIARMEKNHPLSLRRSKK